MSWQIINEILGLAAIDHEFCQRLLVDPLRAAQEQGFRLTPREQSIFNTITARDLQEFSQQVLASLAPENHDA